MTKSAIAIAVSITEKVKHVVMDNTGLDVKKVTVKIDGIAAEHSRHKLHPLPRGDYRRLRKDGKS